MLGGFPQGGELVTIIGKELPRREGTEAVLTLDKGNKSLE